MILQPPFIVQELYCIVV